MTTEDVIKIGKQRGVYPKITPKDKKTNKALRKKHREIKSWERMAERLAQVSNAYDYIVEMVMRQKNKEIKRHLQWAEVTLNDESQKYRKMLRINVVDRT
jgi:ribosomal protein S30